MATEKLPINIKKKEVVTMRHLQFKKGVYVSRKLLTLVLCLLLALSLVLTVGCQKKPGEEQNKAAEKAAEVKDKAAEKATEVKDKATEKATEVQNRADEKAAEVKAKVAGWDACKGCHKDGDKPGPSKATLLKKFKTADEFIKAAKASKNSMMNSFKKDDQLKTAAADLGLK
jgi:hypothetical protein